MSNTCDKAGAFLGGASLQFQMANELWEQLKDENELSLARLVLARIRREEGLLGGLPANRWCGPSSLTCANLSNPHRSRRDKPAPRSPSYSSLPI